MFQIYLFYCVEGHPRKRNFWTTSYFVMRCFCFKDDGPWEEEDGRRLAGQSPWHWRIGHSGAKASPNSPWQHYKKKFVEESYLNSAQPRMDTKFTVQEWPAQMKAMSRDRKMDPFISDNSTSAAAASWASGLTTRSSESLSGAAAVHAQLRCRRDDMALEAYFVTRDGQQRIQQGSCGWITSPPSCAASPEGEVKELRLPSRELTSHIPPWEKENHQLKSTLKMFGMFTQLQSEPLPGLNGDIILRLFQHRL